MDNLTLKQLRYFEALAQHHNFGRAANACSISQPALSMQIKELEETLGSPLFERGARHISLTSFGEAFAKRARSIIQSLDELNDLPRTTDKEIIGRLRIGVIPTIAPYMMPSLIGKLNEHYPLVDLRVRETLTENLIHEMAAGKLDAAIVALPISEPTLHEIPLFNEDFVLVRPVSDAGLQVPNSAKLHEMKLLLLEEGHCFRDQALSFCNMSATRPWEGLDGSSLTTLVQLVAAGMGVTLIPQMAINVETKARNVDVAEFSAPVPSRTIGMIWRKTHPLSEQLMDLSKIVDAAGRTLIGDD